MDQPDDILTRCAFAACNAYWGDTEAMNEQWRTVAKAVLDALKVSFPPTEVTNDPDQPFVVRYGRVNGVRHSAAFPSREQAGSFMESTKSHWNTILGERFVNEQAMPVLYIRDDLIVNEIRERLDEWVP